jgi:hypothetical protein
MGSTRRRPPKYRGVSPNQDVLIHYRRRDSVGISVNAQNRQARRLVFGDHFLEVQALFIVSVRFPPTSTVSNVVRSCLALIL